MLRAFINGKSSASSSIPLHELRCAFTNKIVNHFHPCDASQIKEALLTADVAQKDWKKCAPLERAKLMLNAMRLVERHKEELAELETSNTGRPIRDTLNDVDSATNCLQYYSGLVPSMGGITMDLPNRSWGYTKREPLGLTVGIGAWNYPLLGAVMKIIPALVSGNSMVFKPSQETPSTVLKLAEIFIEAGLPPGLFNVVLGDGQVGAALMESRLVKKVSFTGSVETGRKVNTMAAQSFMEVTMELGGKSPLIIFDDADLEQAVSGAMVANWLSTGQVCSNGTRVYVHENLMPKFLKRLKERTELLKIGDPSDPETQIGPMINQIHLEKVKEYISIGKREGATLYYGSQPLNIPESCQNGHFISPAIFTDCTDNMRIVKEEIFGMVMAVMSFSDEIDVVNRANNSHMGLAAGVYTRDLQRAHRVIDQLEVGTTWINNYNLAPVELPWGGYKTSGIGRENGEATIEPWTQLKSVYVEMEANPLPYF